MEITINELRQMKHKEGMILQGCGGDIQEWVNGINELLTQEDILLGGTKFGNVRSFSMRAQPTCCFHLRM